ncbi:uncharacterized protein LAESUDRAFT_713673 [Laetiporus sulphureus 93-53]|uniref:Uncharacterized protein n=1 Tax=Laetiporus sulphureus 93-53 TaxID=1314785 RepID=A0A165EJA0_9APHY|nr:uncharacterized protein LAESUDRAFT_713673 [Laetiporus sulphureus 93-53]KZT07167.1 hypothetical protein LAESUDRAFT_713673 [Laetiporus sulphureus 93-53]
MFSPSHPDFRIPSATVEETSSSYAYQLPTLADDAAHRSWLVSPRISRRDSISAEARTSSEHHTCLLSDGGLRQPVPSSNAYVRGSPPEHLPSQRFGGEHTSFDTTCIHDSSAHIAQHGPSAPNHRQPPSRSWLLSSTEAQANASHASPELEVSVTSSSIFDIGLSDACRDVICAFIKSQPYGIAVPIKPWMQLLSFILRHRRAGPIISAVRRRVIFALHILIIWKLTIWVLSHWVATSPASPPEYVLRPSGRKFLTFQASDRDVNIAQLYGRLQDVDDRMTCYNDILLEFRHMSETYLSALMEDVRSMHLAGSIGEKHEDCSREDGRGQHSKDHANLRRRRIQKHYPHQDHQCRDLAQAKHHCPHGMEFCGPFQIARFSLQCLVAIELKSRAEMSQSREIESVAFVLRWADAIVSPKLRSMPDQVYGMAANSLCARSAATESLAVDKQLIRLSFHVEASGQNHPKGLQLLGKAPGQTCLPACRAPWHFHGDSVMFDQNVQARGKPVHPRG